MSRFVNTVETVGDDALTDSIIQRSISGAFNDNRITKIGINAFRECLSLTSVNFPSVVIIDTEAFAGCTKLNTVDLATIESIGGAFGWCYALGTIIIRNPAKVCSLSGGFYSSSPLANGTGQIYVPTAFLDEYKAATNWSAYAGQFLALEEWTDDGTIYGDLVSYKVSYRLFSVTSSNTAFKTGNRYTATLTAETEIEEVSITMGGVDITAEVYNAETGEINIPLVTGDLVITAKAAADDVVAGEYIPTGLYVHLDACDVASGATEWVDRVSGIEFALSGFSESSFTGNSVKFTGSENAISYTTMPGTGGVTMEFRLANLNVTKQLNRIFHSLDGLGTHNGRPFVSHANGWASQKGIVASTYGGTNMGTGSLLNANEEYTVSVTVEVDGTKTVYINGESVVSGTSLAPIDFACMCIGHLSVFAGEGFEGELKSMRLYTRALSADEVSSNYVTDETIFGEA